MQQPATLAFVCPHLRRPHGHRGSRVRRSGVTVLVVDAREDPSGLHDLSAREQEATP